MTMEAVKEKGKLNENAVIEEKDVEVEVKTSTEEKQDDVKKIKSLKDLGIPSIFETEGDSLRQNNTRERSEEKQKSGLFSRIKRFLKKEKDNISLVTSLTALATSIVALAKSSSTSSTAAASTTTSSSATAATSTTTKTVTTTTAKAGVLSKVKAAATAIKAKICTVPAAVGATISAGLGAGTAYALEKIGKKIYNNINIIKDSKNKQILLGVGSLAVAGVSAATTGAPEFVGGALATIGGAVAAQSENKIARLAGKAAMLTGMITTAHGILDAAQLLNTGGMSPAGQVISYLKETLNFISSGWKAGMHWEIDGKYLYDIFVKTGNLNVIAFGAGASIYLIKNAIKKVITKIRNYDKLKQQLDVAKIELEKLAQENEEVNKKLEAIIRAARKKKFEQPKIKPEKQEDLEVAGRFINKLEEKVEKEHKQYLEELARKQEIENIRKASTVLRKAMERLGIDKETLIGKSDEEIEEIKKKLESKMYESVSMIPWLKKEVDPKIKELALKIFDKIVEKSKKVSKGEALEVGAYLEKLLERLNFEEKLETIPTSSCGYMLLKEKIEGKEEQVEEKSKKEEKKIEEEDTKKEKTINRFIQAVRVKAKELKRQGKSKEEIIKHIWKYEYVYKDLKPILAEEAKKIIEDEVNRIFKDIEKLKDAANKFIKLFDKAYVYTLNPTEEKIKEKIKRFIEIDDKLKKDKETKEIIEKYLDKWTHKLFIKKLISKSEDLESAAAFIDRTEKEILQIKEKSEEKEEKSQEQNKKEMKETSNLNKETYAEEIFKKLFKDATAYSLDKSEKAIKDKILELMNKRVTDKEIKEIIEKNIDIWFKPLYDEYKKKQRYAHNLRRMTGKNKTQ